MNGPETPNPPTYEEAALRHELNEIISNHYTKKDFVILQDHDLNQSAVVMFAGKLRSRKPGIFLDVEVNECIHDGNRSIYIIISNFGEYQVTENGIISNQNNEIVTDESEFMKLRFWMRETIWSEDHTKAMIQKSSIKNKRIEGWP